MEDKIYVAIGQKVEDRESILNWAIKFSKGATICVIHVHVASQKIPQPNGFLAPLRAVNEVEVIAFQEFERQQVLTILDDCYQFYALKQIPAETVCIERETITDGIFELISQLGIQKLVMGAGTNSKHLRRLTQPTSRKSTYILQRAPAFCHIWFVCKGRLICTREGRGRLNQHPEEYQLNRLSYSSVDSPPAEPAGSSSPLSQHTYHGSPLAPVQQALAEAQLARQEAHEESKRRQIAEQETTNALHKLKEAEEEPSVQSNRNKVLKMFTHAAHEEPSNSDLSTFSYEFLQLDIKEATKFFDPALRIRDGKYDSVYKGFLHYTEVAIKMHKHDSLQGKAKFEQEVDVLSKLRHPNVVTLIGACPESLALIYEYLPNGSLEDRLICKDNTPSLPWQTRIRIATELCSVLNFLHSIQPCSIIHSNLNTKNILLDANFSCKLSGFGFCHIISDHKQIIPGVIADHQMQTSSFVDPEFLEAGNLSPKSDVYSFGIILVRLLTGRPSLAIVEDVQRALENDHLHYILDPTAGDWPVIRAKHLAHMALKCCSAKAKDRPDLGSEVWTVLKPVMTPTESLSSPLLLVNGDQVPSYFICPIFQEIMRDPHIAADGFTYEADAVRGWFEGGHHTSPMTNLSLDNQNLIPNRALRSAILEWLQKHKHSSL